MCLMLAVLIRSRGLAQRWWRSCKLSVAIVASCGPSAPVAHRLPTCTVIALGQQQLPSSATAAAKAGTSDDSQLACDDLLSSCLFGFAGETRTLGDRLVERVIAYVSAVDGVEDRQLAEHQLSLAMQ